MPLVCATWLVRRELLGNAPLTMRVPLRRRPFFPVSFISHNKAHASGSLVVLLYFYYPQELHSKVSIYILQPVELPPLDSTPSEVKFSYLTRTRLPITNSKHTPQHHDH
jgi:hypothetical protein